MRCTVSKTSKWIGDNFLPTSQGNYRMFDNSSSQTRDYQRTVHADARTHAHKHKHKNTNFVTSFTELLKNIRREIRALSLLAHRLKFKGDDSRRNTSRWGDPIAQPVIPPDIRPLYYPHKGCSPHRLRGSPNILLSRYQGSCPDEHKNGPGVNLTTHFDLASKFGINGAVCLLPPTWLRGSGREKTVPLPEAEIFVAVRIQVRTQQLCLGQLNNNCYLAVDSKCLEIPVFRTPQ